MTDNAEFTEFTARATVQNLIMNGLGASIEQFDMPKLLENLFKLNAKSWDISNLDEMLILEIIAAHRN